MLTTDDLRFLCTLASEPSLAATARVLNVTAPAVSQRLQSLERKLGVRLLNRSTRRLTLTDEGELIEAEGRSMLMRLDQLEEEIAQRREEVVGKLRVLAPTGFGRLYIAPALSTFRERYPRVQIELLLSDKLGRHPEQNWDLAIHIGELVDSGLIVRSLAPNRRFACASPDYLHNKGMPQTPQDLCHHDCIALRENDEDVTLWRFTVHGEAQPIRIEPVLACNDGEIVRDWALDGRGIIVRSEWSVSNDLASGRLVRVLENYRLPDANVVALFGSRDGGSRRVRVFVDELTSQFQPPPWRQKA
jgi:DNA-binding transcriptional LysR family regulator